MSSRSRRFKLEFIKNWRELGTPFESSSSLVDKVVREITAREVIELGAGTGPVTRGILRYHKDIKVNAFENNLTLVSELYKINDNRLRVIPESAEKISEYFPDLTDKCIVCGLPLSSMNQNVVDRILSQCKEVDKFIAYKYFSSDKLIKRYFDKVDRKRIFSNFPFAVVYVATSRIIK